MTEATEMKTKIIIDLEMLNSLNASGCPACGGKFALGETAVAACGNWDGGPRYVHENEAVYDKSTSCYVVR
jgi:hypothetical protein